MTARRRRRAAPAASTTALLAVSLVVSLALGEMLLRLLLPASDTYLALTPNRTVVFDPQFQPGVRGPARYEVNSMGARGREWAADRDTEYRILAMGGSTTESLYNDQPRTWPALLESKLGTISDGRTVWVGNIGKSGLSSRHHVLQARHLMEVYDPDAVLLLVGVNDFAARLQRGSQYDPRYMENGRNLARLEDRAFEVVPGRLPGPRWEDDPWFKRTTTWRLLRLVRNRISGADKSQDRRGSATRHWRELRAAGERASQLPPLTEALDEYGRNLTEIASLVGRHGARLILMTQPVLWRPGLTPAEEALLWMGGEGDFRSGPGALYYRPEALARGMDAYNARLLEVCAVTASECLDLAAEIPKTTRYFWDDCHFTDLGQERIADLVAAFHRRLAPQAAEQPGST